MTLSSTPIWDSDSTSQNWSWKRRRRDRCHLGCEDWHNVHASDSARVNLVIVLSSAIGVAITMAARTELLSRPSDRIEDFSILRKPLISRRVSKPRAAPFRRPHASAPSSRPSRGRLVSYGWCADRAACTRARPREVRPPVSSTPSRSTGATPIGSRSPTTDRTQALCRSISQGQCHCVRHWEVCRQEHCQQAQHVVVLAATGAGRLCSCSLMAQPRDTASRAALTKSVLHRPGPKPFRQRWAVCVRLPACH
jgi:hypothetical protein